MNPIFLRLFLALGIIAAGYGVYVIANRIILKRAAKNYLGLDEFRPGLPTVLYFTMEGCVPCKTTQRPALELLKEITGDRIQVIRVDAVEQPELAESWGVLSVPTTFIIDGQGKPRRVNHGVALAEKLLNQLEEVTGKSLTVEKAKHNVEASASTSGD